MASGWQGIRVALASDPRYLGAIRTIIRESAGLAGLTRDEAAEIELAVTEACANVIRHCYGDCSENRIDVVFTLRDGFFEIQVDDYGTFVDPARMKGRDLDDIKPGGLGLHLIHKLMDEVIYEKNSWGGTHLILRKRAATDQPADAEGGAPGHNAGQNPP
jgi:anti-sigma regulatory factor (Ser/Thr protein kinase)